MNMGGHLASARQRRRMRKGMYILPSLFTTANLAAGYYAISQACLGTQTESWHFDFAAKAIGFAVFFDGLDGTIARLTNTASEFGKELDSLADVVTFGVAPALLAFMWGFHFLPMVLSPDLRIKLVQVGAIASFIFLAAGAARLARFNIQVNPQPKNPGRPGKKYFVGMPIPGGAGCIAALVHFQSGEPIQLWWTAILWIIYILGVGFLMVSTWRFWSMKSIDFRSRHPFRLVLIMCLIIAAIWTFSRVVLFAMAILYMLSGVLARLLYGLSRSSAAPPAPPQVSGAQ